MTKTRTSSSPRWVPRRCRCCRLTWTALSYDLRHKANTETSQQRKNEALKRLKVVEAFREANTRRENRPEWMVMKVVPGDPAGTASAGAPRWWPLSPPPT
jgi:DNA-directed RNA polymerase beta' subunit